jgi:gliding motility-associated-like protein
MVSHIPGKSIGMNRTLFVAWLMLLALMPSALRATHIVGAELIYTCLGNNGTSSTYQVDLVLYRDCFAGQANFDPFIYLYVFNDDAANSVHGIEVVNAPPNTPQINPADLPDCVANTLPICVERGVYSTTITLPNSNDGYHIAWSRCCRNSAITNLTVPLSEGITYLATIPPTNVAPCNSMPTFDQVPPIFLCNNLAFSFDHSATDPDGDSLAYALVDPYTGTNFQGLGTGNPNFTGNQPVIDPNPPINNPMGPPPYDNVNFQAGYSFTDPFGSGNTGIDPQSGLLTVTPNQTGIFVFAIEVREYRNGVLIGANRRDFQIHVIECIAQPNPPTISHDLTGLNTSGDTILVEGGEPFCYDVTITGDPTADLQAYTVSDAFGANVIPPAASFTFTGGTNPINGQVCWTPACAYDGQTIPLIVGAVDDNGCQNFGNVFDTVWVKIETPPNTPPVITPDLTGLNVSGDTIYLFAKDNLCIDYTISDPNGPDMLTTFPVSPIFQHPNNPPTFTATGTNPIAVQVCWTPSCAFEGQVVPIRIGARDSSLCKVNQTTESLFYVSIETPPNQAPTITTDLSGLNTSGDTVILDVEDSFCFSFTGIDSDLGDLLSLDLVSPIFNDPNGPTVSTTGSNPIQAQVCWTPGCAYEGQTFTLIYGVEDPGQCSNEGKAYDTTYVRVNIPPNQPPSISVNLSGNVVNGDTIFAFANDGLCFDVIATDPDGGDMLTIDPQSPIFTQPDGPSVTHSPGNPANTQICWTPSCDFVGDLIPMVFEVSDDKPCSAQAFRYDTVFVQIDLPPNDPPTASHDLSGLETNGDTILIEATEQICYTVDLVDFNPQDSLTFFTESSVFNSTNPPSVILNGINPMQAQICWTPTCDDEDQVVALIVGARDNGECNNSLEVRDTVYVRIYVPFTAPPVVEVDLSGNPYVSNDTISIDIAGEACYSFFIADLSAATGFDYDYRFEDLFGNSLPIDSFEVVQQDDSIFGNVCFQANCSNGGTVFRSIVTGIDLKNCPPFDTRSDTVFIKVNTDFSSFAGGDTFFCAGTGGVQLRATAIGGTAPYYYQWYCDNPGFCGFSNANDSTPTVNPDDTTVYSVQITDANGCTSEFDDIVVNVNELPRVDAGPDQFACLRGAGAQLRAEIVNAQAAPPPYEFRWVPAAGLSNPNIQDPYATPDTTTIYTVIVDSYNGCSSDATTLDTLSTITVEVRPTPVAEAGPDLNICLGDTALLQGYADGAGPGYDYIWTPSIGMTDSSEQITEVKPPSTTTYYLITWSNGCPSPADSATVIVHTVPTLIGDEPDYETCAFDSVGLKVVSGGSIIPTAYTYQWTPSVGLSDPTVRDPTASPPVSTDYRVQVTSNYGCGSAELVVPVTVLPTPLVDAGTDTLVCGPLELQLDATYTVAGAGDLNGPIFYQWDQHPSLSSWVIANPVAQTTQSTMYYVEARSGSCRSRDSLFIDIFDATAIEIEADTNRICRGAPLTLRALGGRGSTIYDWSPGFSLSDSTIADPEAIPQVSTDYVVTATEGICVAQDTFALRVNPTPEAGYAVSQVEGCAPLTVSFEAPSPDAVAYVWDFGDSTAISNLAQPTHTYEQPGSYPVSLTLMGEGGCSSQIVQYVIDVSERGEARFSLDWSEDRRFILPDAEVSFIDQSRQAEQYFWDFGDGSFSTEANPSHVYQDPGSYEVSLTITDAGGCTDTYGLGPIEIGHPELRVPNVFTPNGDGVNDEYVVAYDGQASVSLAILDRWGRQVFRNENGLLPGWDGLLEDGSEAKEGTYFYVLRIGEHTYKGSLTLIR